MRRLSGRYPHWKLVETDDTGHSAQLLAEQRPPGVAVVAGAQAAAQFSLEILAPAIHDDPHNYTRFLVLERAGSTPTPWPIKRRSISARRTRRAAWPPCSPA